MTITTMRRSTNVLSVFALLAIVSGLVRKARTMNASDPLKDSGLTDVELRIYRYLLALQTLSKYGDYPQNNMSAETVRKFIDDNHAAVCTTCGRWYLAEVMYCPYHHVPTREVSANELSHAVEEWEMFRRRYSETNRIKPIARVLAIKLHYYLDQKEES